MFTHQSASAGLEKLNQYFGVLPAGEAHDPTHGDMPICYIINKEEYKPEESLAHVSIKMMNPTGVQPREDGAAGGVVLLYDQARGIWLQLNATAAAMPPTQEVLQYISSPSFCFVLVVTSIES